MMQQWVCVSVGTNHKDKTMIHVWLRNLRILKCG